MGEPTIFWYQKAATYAETEGFPLEKLFIFNEDQDAFINFKVISKGAGLKGEEIELALAEFKKRKVEYALSASKKPKNQVVWNDPESALRFLQSQEFYIVKHKPQTIIQDAKYYPLMQRDRAKELLWQSQFIRYECFLEKNMEKKNHPISVFAGASGIGKTRMMQDFVSILKNIAASNKYGERFESFKAVLPYTVEVLMTFSSGTGYLKTEDDQLDATTAVIMRLLYAHFVDQTKMLFSEFQRFLKSAGCVKLTFADIIDMILLQKPETKCIYFGIDEFQELLIQKLVANVSKGDMLREQRSRLEEFVVALGNIQCTSKVFIMSSMAGTAHTDISAVIASSLYTANYIPLPLLQPADQETVIESLGWDTVKTKWKICATFRNTLLDMGGLPKAMDWFIRAAEQFRREDPDCNNWDYGALMDRVASALGVETNSKYYPDIIACALLRLPVGREESPNTPGITWGELERQGLVVLESVEKDLLCKLPPIMLIYMLYKLPDNPVWVKLKKLLTSMSSWKGWEEFNWYYEAVRTELFLVAKRTKLDIKEFYRGADFSSVSDCLFQLEEVALIRANHRWPSDESHIALSEAIHSKSPVVKCVDSNVCDIFHAVFVGKDRSKINEDFCYILQFKEPKTATKISLSLVLEEVDKCKEAMKQAVITQFRVLLLTTKKLIFEPKDLPENVLIVHCSNFEQYFSHTLAARALANLSTPNINTISRENLVTLEGIGDQYASTILHERETRPFSSNKDFQNRIKLYSHKWTF